MNRCFIDNNTKGTVNPAHNCKNCSSGGSNTLMPDWKPFPFFYKGNVPCKHNNYKKHFPPDRVNVFSPVIQYISDRRPCGVTRQQLDSVECFFEAVSRITLLCLLNGSAGYRTDSEDTIKCPGWSTVFNVPKCIKQNMGTNTVIPDICLERRSIISTIIDLKPLSIFEFRDGRERCIVVKCA